MQVTGQAFNRLEPGRVLLGAASSPAVGKAPRRSVAGRAHALLAGGGTGGHVFPALAVAEELRRRDWRVSFVGRRGGLEERVAAARGIPFYPLAARPLIGRSSLARIRALATLAGAAVRAWSLVRRLDVAVVVGTGGFVSAPAVVGACLAGRRVLLFEPNAEAGAANRWLSRCAHGASVASERAGAQLRCPVWMTGVPVREEFFAVPPESPASTRRLLVLGGSQGARKLNRCVPGALRELCSTFPGLSVLHQVGEANLEEARAAYSAAFPQGWEQAGLELEVVPFLGDVAGAMARSHLVLSRAGAVTLAEICAAGRSALLIPLALAGGHQGENAQVLEEAGAAAVLSNDELTSGTLASAVTELLRDPGRLAEMGRAARRQARPQAREAIVDRIEGIARGR